MLLSSSWISSRLATHSPKVTAGRRSSCIERHRANSRNELLFGIILTGGTPAQTLSPALLALSPLMPGFRTEFVLFAAASILSTVPPLLLALFFQRYITGLNIVDPVTVATD